MSAVILTIGSELLRPGRRDTNAEWLLARLLDFGIVSSARVMVGDEVSRLARFVTAAREEASVVLLTGGLGPTDDDKTREAVALALGVPLERDPAMAERIEALFTARGRTPSARQTLQADRPEGAAWIDNPLGSAPGFLVETGGRLLVALPGVPAEMKSMFERTVAPMLALRARGSIARTTLKIAGRPESYVDDLVRDLYDRDGTETTILASAGSVELLLTAEGLDVSSARERLAQLSGAMRDRLGVDVFGVDQDTLAGVTGGLLVARGATVATAESCTGGLLGGALTDVPGSSAWFRGGVVCYANELKTTLAEVPPALIAAHGAVSEPVVRALAAGVRRVCAATYGLGITGIAGPEGGTADKPVGTVFVAVADEAEVRALKLDWPGDRDTIRRRAVTIALDLLRRRLLA